MIRIVDTPRDFRIFLYEDFGKEMSQSNLVIYGMVNIPDVLESRKRALHRLANFSRLSVPT